MTENEIAILCIIRESKDPAKAMQIAVETLIGFMAEHCPGKEVAA